MSKLNIARTVFECCLGGGCVAGGVECYRSKKVSNVAESFEKYIKGLKAHNVKKYQVSEYLGCLKTYMDDTHDSFACETRRQNIT